MRHSILALLCLLLSIVSPALSLKVLVYQTAFGGSHVQFSGTLVDALVERGHVVDKILMAYNPSVSNGTTKARHIYRIKSKGESPWLKMQHMTNPMEARQEDGHKTLQHFHEAKRVFCEALLDDHDLLETLKNEAYDIALTSAYDGCPHGLFHLLAIPVTTGYVATGWLDDVAYFFGIPSPPSFVTGVLAGYVTTDRLSFRQRFRNLRSRVSRWIRFRSPFPEEQAVFDKRFSDFPRLDHLFRRMTYVFLNTDELLDKPRPLSSKMKHIGGIAIKQPKPVDENFEKILSVRSKGTIIFSFGTLVKTESIALKTRRVMAKTFASFEDYTFIWKYDAPDDDADVFQNYTNIVPVKWLPQTDLLNDPRVIAFITHMGLNSFLEVSYAGKPTVAIPLFGDQQYNAGCALRNGAGVVMDKTHVDAKRLKKALKDVLEDPKYSVRAQEISQMLHHRPVTPKDTFLTHIEYAAKFPMLEDQLNLASSEMNFITYFCLDVIALVTVIAFAALYALWKVALAGIKFVRNIRKSKTKKE